MLVQHVHFHFHNRRVPKVPAIAVGMFIMGSQATYLEVKVEKASSNIFCLDRPSVIELWARAFKL
jgi:hypothetical protein